MFEDDNGGCLVIILAIIIAIALGKYSTYLQEKNAYLKESIPKVGFETDKEALEYFDDPVVLNIKSKIYHETNCIWAKECTENCVYIEREVAEWQGRHCYECD